MKSRTWVIVSLFLLASQAPAAVQKSSKEYWADLGFKFTAIDKHLTSDKCNATETDFVACITGVNSALMLMSKRLVLVPTDRQKSEQGFGPVGKDFGNIRAVGPKKLKGEKVTEIYLEQKDEKRRTSQGWTDLFARKSVSPVNFESIKAWLISQPDLLKDESYAVGLFMNGRIGVLTDPHTVFIPEQQEHDSFSAAESDFVGIGVALKTLSQGGKITFLVETPLEGGPALKAGVRANDVIVKVDGVSADTLKIEELTDKIKGTPGTTVKLTLLRGTDTIDIDITREKIQRKNVVIKLLGANKDIGYIKLASFAVNGPDDKPIVYSEMLAGMEELVKHPIKAVIFDVRNNLGGYLTESIRVAGLFLKKNSLALITRDLQGGNERQFRTFDEQITNVPMVTLINSRSASASEILAGALQDHQRSFIVGERSFGKGTVQQQKPRGNGLVLRETTQRFYRPSGLTNQIQGDEPDVEVFVNPNPTAEDKIAFREEDEYAALPPIGAKWKQPRPQTVKLLKDCVKKGTADATFKADQSAAIPPDYQLLVAQDAVECIISERLDSKRDSQALSSIPEVHPLGGFLQRSLNWDHAEPIPQQD
ncbi:S41 family peptidase [bacterium]|nr:S41 family peptidase [bacterium]